MKMALPCRSKWWRLSLLLLGAGLVPGAPARATGYYGPSDYLSGGGANVAEAPEFYWELEVKRLARGFRPKQGTPAPAGVFPPRAPSESMFTLEEALQRPTSLTAQADEADFALALQQGYVKPPDAAGALQQHKAGREATIEDEAAWQGFVSEFSDYQRGAAAYRAGAEHYAEARQAWEALLQRPAAERHFRSVWAAFMLGKLALKEAKPEAVSWFQKTRALAQAGFADSLALAADSYGWEARSEWKQGHPEKAAPLYLTQLALGDESAVESLKALIPDRAEVDGMMNYGPSPEEMETWGEPEKKTYAARQRAALGAAARDPLLRRLETVHVLATSTGYYGLGEAGDTDKSESRLALWLKAIQEAGVKQTEDAEYLGWAAYHLGDYAGAARWLDLAKGSSPAAHWLRAKLQRRAGKLAEAAKSMVLAWKGLQKFTDYTGWQAPPPEPLDPQAPDADAAEEAGDDEPVSEGGWKFTQHAGGDLGGLQLARGEFLHALEAFRKGGLWEDAAYVADSILTLAELKAYVDREPVPAPAPKQGYQPEGGTEALRWLLGRRLVRASRLAEAAPYFPAPYAKLLQVYARELKAGADEQLSETDRANSWFTAAWIARYDGMELMGTEVAPDGFINRGGFPIDSIAQERRTGKITVDSEETGEGNKPARPQPIILSATAEEVKRLKQNRVTPDVRYHYRNIAAALAMKAAQLLPDHTPELADVINTAGGWIKNRDENEEIADRYYETLLRRAGQTEIGGHVRKQRWFVDETGPWSGRMADAHEALAKELKLEEAP